MASLCSALCSVIGFINAYLTFIGWIQAAILFLAVKPDQQLDWGYVVKIDDDKVHTHI